MEHFNSPAATIMGEHIHLEKISTGKNNKRVYIPAANSDDLTTKTLSANSLTVNGNVSATGNISTPGIVSATNLIGELGGYVFLKGTNLANINNDTTSCLLFDVIQEQRNFTTNFVAEAFNNGTRVRNISSKTYKLSVFVSMNWDSVNVGTRRMFFWKNNSTQLAAFFMNIAENNFQRHYNFGANVLLAPNDFFNITAYTNSAGNFSSPTNSITINFF